MSDFGTMKTRIAGELNRTDLDSEIGSAILSAIQHYSSTPWWFLETADTLTTSTNIQTVAQPDDFVSLVVLKVTENNSTYPLIERGFDWIEDRYRSGSSDTGTPAYFGMFGADFYLWPIPDDAYSLPIRYRAELTALSDDDDTNAWMTTGEELIRSRANADMKARYLMDQAAINEAASFSNRGERFLSGMEKNAFGALRRRQHTHSASGKLRATRF